MFDFDSDTVWIVIIIVAMFAVIFVLSYYDAKDWEKYRIEHHCVERGYISGSTSVGSGITSNGKFGTITTYTPGKTRWVCDDGVEIYR